MRPHPRSASNFFSGVGCSQSLSPWPFATVRPHTGRQCAGLSPRGEALLLLPLCGGGHAHLLLPPCGGGREGGDADREIGNPVTPTPNPPHNGEGIRVHVSSPLWGRRGGAGCTAVSREPQAQPSSPALRRGSIGPHMLAFDGVNRSLPGARPGMTRSARSYAPCAGAWFPDSAC